MSRSWNGKALLDSLGKRLWDPSSTFRSTIIEFANEIQDDIASELPLKYFLFKMKKLLPVNQEQIDLSPDIPVTPAVSMSDTGSLTVGSTYHVSYTFLIFDSDGLKYIESEPSDLSNHIIPTTANRTINVSGIGTYQGDDTASPTTIYRRIYLTIETDGVKGDSLFITDIKNNTDTTISITDESTSTITPPSATEIDQLSSKQLYFNTGNRYMLRVDMNQIKRFSPTSSTSTTPSSYDFLGPYRIFLYPKLASGSTTAQRTLIYWVLRRPHEIFYDVNSAIDLPITAKMAIKKGVEWLAYDYRDRDGKQGKEDEYVRYKKKFLLKMRRQKGAPSHVRDVNGSTQGFEL